MTLKQELNKFDEEFGKDQYGGKQAFRQDLVKTFIHKAEIERLEKRKEKLIIEEDKSEVGISKMSIGMRIAELEYQIEHHKQQITNAESLIK